MECSQEDKILTKLDQWEKDEGNLPENIELYRKALLIQSEVKASISLPPASDNTIYDRLSQQIPLISFDELGIEPSLFSGLFAQIKDLIQKSLFLSENETDWLQAMSDNEKLLYQIAGGWYENAAAIESKYPQVEREFIPTVMQSVLWPWLSLKSTFLIGNLDQEKWRKGYCPLCFGRPDFAYLAENDGSRWLSCFRCDGEWLFQRLECPYCSNTNQKQLSSFINDDSIYRVYVCRKCQTYLGAIDLRQCRHEIIIPLEKVKSFNLNCQYQEMGFQPGWIGSI